MTKKRRLAYFLLLLTAVLWGFASPVIKYTLEFINPIPFLFYRFWLVSLIFLIPLIINLKKDHLSGQGFLKIFLTGILGGPLTLLLIFWGIDKTTSLSASLIVAMSPLFIVLGGAIFLKEKVTKKEQIGTVIALLGTIITIIQPSLGREGLNRSHLWGNFLIFIHNFVWATYCILIKKESQKYSPLILTAITFISGVFVLTPLFFIQKIPLFEINSMAIPGILYMSIFSSVVAYTTYNWGISLIEASEATLFSYLQPLFAAPLAFFWLGEKITLPFIIGAVIIAMGVYLTESRGKNFSKI